MAEFLKHFGWGSLPIGLLLGWMLYVAIVRYRRNRGWPRVDRRQVNRRRIDRREMLRIDKEYGQKDRGRE